MDEHNSESLHLSLNMLSLSKISISWHTQICVIIIFLPGVFFTVTFTGAHQFLEGEIIKFDTIITNSGDGYVTSNGKFITPVNGTYQFSGTFYNVSKKIGAYVKKNNGTVVSANNGKDGTASFSVILDLVEGDEVYLERPHWVDDDAEYSYVSSFSGFLLHNDV